MFTAICDSAKGSEPWHIGHIVRDVPEGYFETLATGQNRLHHEGLGRYYEALRTVMRAPVLDSERLAVMWRFWCGEFDADLQSYIDEHYHDPPRIIVPSDRLAALQPAGTYVWWEDNPATVVVYRGGLDVRFAEPTTGSRIRLSLGDDHRYELTFRRDGVALAAVTVRSLAVLFAGLQLYEVAVPGGIGPFDSIWIDVPTLGPQKLACISGLAVES